jgi:hypothetical protein
VRSTFHLSICVRPSLCRLMSPLITFKSIIRILWNLVKRSCHWRWPQRYSFWSRSINHSKMAEVQTCEVGVKFASGNVGPWYFVCLWIIKRSTSNEAVFVKKQNSADVEGGWKLTLLLCFMEKTHEIFHFLLDEIQVASAFSASEMCEMEPWSVTCQKFAERDGRERKGGKGANLISSFLFLSSFYGSHDGLCHQGHRPKTMDGTILYNKRSWTYL